MRRKLGDLETRLNGPVRERQQTRGARVADVRTDHGGPTGTPAQQADGLVDDRTGGQGGLQLDREGLG